MTRPLATLHRAVLVGAAACLLSVPAQAGFSNFGPNFETDTVGQGFFTGQTIAMSFTASATGDVTDIYAAIVNAGGEFALTLYDDNGGTPGTQLGSWALTHNVPFGGAPAHVDVGGTVSVTGGETYWLSAHFTDPAAEFQGSWALNSTGDTGLFSQSFFGGPFSPGAEQTTGALAVLVPAPSALGVFVLSGLFASRRRRK